MFGLGQTQECALSRQDIWDQVVEELNFKKSCRKRTSILRLSFLISTVLGCFLTGCLAASSLSCSTWGLLLQCTDSLLGAHSL